MMALLGSVVFGAVVLGGYLVPWAWTGFTGNTLWDWLHLLLLPLLIPILVVPALMPIAKAGVVEVEEANDAADPPDGATDDHDEATSEHPEARSSQPGSHAGSRTPPQLEHREHAEPRSS